MSVFCTASIIILAKSKRLDGLRRFRRRKSETGLLSYTQKLNITTYFLKMHTKLKIFDSRY